MVIRSFERQRAIERAIGIVVANTRPGNYAVVYPPFKEKTWWKVQAVSNATDWEKREEKFPSAWLYISVVAPIPKEEEEEYLSP